MVWGIENEYLRLTVESSVVGDAGRVLSKIIGERTTQKIFDTLQSVFGLNFKTFSHLSNLKQKPDETARLFESRVTDAVNLLNLTSTVSYDPSCLNVMEELKLSTFFQGLRPEIQKKINIYSFKNLEEATVAVSRLDHISTKDNPKLFQLQGDNRQYRTTRYTSRPYEHSKASSSSSRDEKKDSSTSTRQSLGDYLRNRPCFHCKIPGHSFRRCRKASKADIDAIEDSLKNKARPSKLNDRKDQKGHNKDQKGVKHVRFQKQDQDESDSYSQKSD